MFSILLSIIVLGILVIVHEFGHFFAAKKCGVLVEEFAVGMGPKLISKQIGDTEYSLRALPFGGFCRMQGETDEGTIGPRSFLNKPPLARLIIFAAGPFMNFVLAFIMMVGLTSTSAMALPEIREVVPGSPMAEIGLQAGDTIYRINGKRIHIYDEMQMALYNNGGKELRLDILREGNLYTYQLTPHFDEARQGYVLGFYPAMKTGLFAEPVEGYERSTVLETVNYSFFSMVNFIRQTAIGLTRVFTFTADQSEYGGPITIVKMVGDTYEAGMSYSLTAAIQNLVYLAAVLGANLGVLNLFPIPALDGGKIVLVLVEMIRRKPLSVALENKIQFLGFAFIMGIMGFVLYGDIVKLFA